MLTIIIATAILHNIAKNLNEDDVISDDSLNIILLPNMDNVVPNRFEYDVDDHIRTEITRSFEN